MENGLPDRARSTASDYQLRIGETDSGASISLDDKRVATSGTAILAMRGAGKSWLNGVLAEGLVQAGYPIVIVDPEGEYWTLKVAFPDIAVAGGEHSDLPLSVEIAKDLANIVVKERISMIIDLSDFRRFEQRMFLTLFLDELFFLETTARMPLWITFEEADLWIPQKSETPCKSSVLDICQRGRKRGIGFSLVSQRPATIDKTGLSQAEIRFFKRFQQPHDLSAISEYLGPYAQFASRLPDLPSTDAIVYAPTEFERPVQVVIARRISPHGGATPEQMASVRPSPAISSIRERLSLLLKTHRDEASEVAKFQKRVITLEKQLEAKGKELERTKAALELAAALRLESPRGAKREQIGEDITGLRVGTIDTRTGRIIGNGLDNLLFNEFTPEERAVYLTLLKSEKPLNAKNLSALVDYSRVRLMLALKRLERKNVIQRTRALRKGKFYVANKLS